MNSNRTTPPGRPAGLWMLVISFVCGLGLLTLFFEDRLARQFNPNQNPVSMTAQSGAQEVLLRRNRQGHYVVSGGINGQDAVFLLDTGATDVVVSQELAQRARLSQGARSLAMTANGTVSVYSTVIPELQLGSILLQDVRASINPAMSGNTVLLGMSALRHIEFAQQGDRLTLRYLP